MTSKSKSNEESFASCQHLSSSLGSLGEKALGERIKQLIYENNNLISNFKVMENSYQCENNQLQLELDNKKSLHEKSIHKNMVLTKLLALYQNKILELVEKTKLILHIKEDNDLNLSRMNVSMKQMDILIENQKHTIESLELKLFKQAHIVETNQKLANQYEVTNKTLTDRLAAQDDLIQIAEKKYAQLDELFQIKCKNIDELQEQLNAKEEGINFLNIANENINKKDRMLNDQIVTRISRTSLLSASTNSLRESVEKLVKEELAKNIKKISHNNRKTGDSKYNKQKKKEKSISNNLMSAILSEKEAITTKERKKCVMKGGSLTRLKMKNDVNDREILKLSSKNESSLAIAIGIHKDYDPVLLDTINF